MEGDSQVRVAQLLTGCLMKEMRNNKICKHTVLKVKTFPIMLFSFSTMILHRNICENVKLLRFLLSKRRLTRVGH